MTIVQHTAMPPPMRRLFEHVTTPFPNVTKHDITEMLAYIDEHGVHHVYCKVKEFMPRHYQMLKAMAKLHNR